MNIVVSLNDKTNIEAFCRRAVSHLLISDDVFSCMNRGMSREEMKEVISRAHQNNVKVWARVDRIYQQSELKQLEEYLLFLDGCGCDGILFSDVAVRMMVLQLDSHMECIYAPETLLTNSHDVAALKQDGFNGAVISKDIPLEDVYDIINDNPQYCYLRVFGPVLIAYSRRRYISDYLNEDKPHLFGYSLQEESRPQLLPIVEKQQGSWLYGGTLESLDELGNLLASRLSGVIFDGIIYDDQFMLKVLDIHQDLMNGKCDVRQARRQLQMLDEEIWYLSLSDIRKTALTKEQI